MVVVLVLAAVAVPSSALAGPMWRTPIMETPDAAALDRYVEAEREALRIPGLALGIVQGDRIVHLAGFGVAGPDGSPVTPETPFLLASTSKSFTALATMQLVERGMIDLDAPVQRYLTWFRVADEVASARITVRHLLNQTSGLSLIPTGNRHVPDGDVRDDALERRVRDLQSERLTTPVGTTYQYSSPNYATLGLIVQSVSGQSYESYVEEHIFAPLEMRRSFASQAEARPHGLATGYRSWFGIFLPYDMPENRAERSSGFLISSAGDMARYLIPYLNGGRSGSTRILSPAGITEMHRPAVRDGESDTFYAMGWSVGPLNGIPAVHHNGVLPHAYTEMVLLPEPRWGIVLLMNANDRALHPRLAGIAAGVASLLVDTAPSTATADPFFLGVRGVVLGALAVQVAGLGRALVLRHRPARPVGRPLGRAWIAWHVSLPLLLNGAWALVILVATPWWTGLSLRTWLFLFPDLGAALVASAVVSLGWCILLVTPMLVSLRASGRPTRPNDRIGNGPSMPV